MQEHRRLQVFDAAQYVGLSVSTLNKFRLFGGGPRYLKLGKKRVVYDTRDLDAWLNSRRRTSTSEAARAGLAMTEHSEGPRPGKGAARRREWHCETRSPFNSPPPHSLQAGPDALPGPLGPLARAYLARERRGFATVTHRFGWFSRESARAREAWSAALCFWHTVRAEGAGP